MSQDEYTGQKEVRIVRGRVDSLSLYEITDHELEILEKGSPVSLYLNFGIFLLSVGFSFLIALFSVDIQSARIFAVFVILSCVGIIGGVFLISIWHSMKGSVSDIVKKIRMRITEQEPTSDIPDESKS